MHEPIFKLVPTRNKVGPLTAPLQLFVL